MNKRVKRGRPSEQPLIVREKYTQTFYEVPSKQELGWKSIWHFDLDKSKVGPWKTEHTPPKGYRHPKIKVDKQQTYSSMPVVMVFKTSNRSNAKTKMKVWKNENIDYILTAPKLPGVPDKAEILEVGVGESFIEKYQSKYNL